MPPIECKLGFAETPVGNDTYVFARNKTGHFVADVANLKHVQILLSRPAVYAEYRQQLLAGTALADPVVEPVAEEDPLADVEIDVVTEDELDAHPATEAEEAARQIAASEAARFESLLGSDILPAMVAITPDLTVQLGEVVARAHKDSELTIEQWNTLPTDEREALLVKAIEVMQAEATPAPEEVPEPVVEQEPPPPDDLAVLNGIGPSSAAKLRDAGVLYFAQLAALTDAEMAVLDTQLKLNGLSARGKWVQVAKDHLAAGN